MDYQEWWYRLYTRICSEKHFSEDVGRDGTYISGDIDLAVRVHIQSDFGSNFVYHMNRLKAGSDYIPELGFFSRELVRKRGVANAPMHVI